MTKKHIIRNIDEYSEIKVKMVIQFLYNQICHRLINSGLTKEQYLRGANIPTEIFSQIESGNWKPKLSEFVKIAMQCNLVPLVGFEEYRGSDNETND